MQIEVQATTRSTLPKDGSPEADGSEGSAGDAKVITDGNQAGSSEVHDVSPSSPSGNGNHDNKSGSNASGKAESTSGRQSDSQAGTSESSTKSGSKSGVIRSVDTKSSEKSKPSSSGQSGTIGGRGTQEEYQEARLRFLSSGQGVLVSADSVSIDEGQVGSLVTASFDDL